MELPLVHENAGGDGAGGGGLGSGGSGFGGGWIGGGGAGSGGTGGGGLVNMTVPHREKRTSAASAWDALDHVPTSRRAVTSTTFEAFSKAATPHAPSSNAAMHVEPVRCAETPYEHVPEHAACPGVHAKLAPTAESVADVLTRVEGLSNCA
jgi:hypothetical protein